MILDKFEKFKDLQTGVKLYKEVNKDITNRRPQNDTRETKRGRMKEKEKMVSAVNFRFYFNMHPIGLTIILGIIPFEFSFRMRNSYKIG